MADESSLNIQALLLERSLELDAYLRQRRIGFGLETLTLAELRLLAALTEKVNSSSRLAEQLGTSRQAAHVLVTALCKKGLLALKDSGVDKREKIVATTGLGLKHRRSLAKLLRAMELDIAKALGSRNFKRLSKILQKRWLT